MSRTVTAKDPKPTSERIEQLAQRVLIGDIILPEFQRPFVWKKSQILRLLDSIYRNYPIGSVLLWESTQDLASKRSIADLQVGERSPSYPWNYLLDGQQRLSTICGVLHWEPGDPRSVWNVAFDLRSKKFVHVDHANELPANIMPLRRLKDPADYFRRTSAIDSEELRATADLLFNRFKDYQLPLVTLGDMSIDDVAPVFERINSTGTRLTIYDLMRAATWSPEFDLGETIQTIKGSLEPKRFHNFDNKTFLRILSAACGDDFSSGSIDALRTVPTDKLNTAASDVRQAAERAVDFLATEIGAPRSESLPYANQFAVLAELFRLLPNPSSLQRARIREWFWATTISGYFAGWDSGQMGSDSALVRNFAAGTIDRLDVQAAMPNFALWKVKSFRSNSAVSKMLGLILGGAHPLDLITGQLIDMDKSLAWSNDKEYHHFFPQAFLKKAGVSTARTNAVGNMILLTSKSNIEILDKAPSVYLSKIIATDGRAALIERLRSNLVPDAALDAALADDYEAFLSIRAAHLHRTVEMLAGRESPSTEEVDPAEVDDSDEDSTD